MAAVTEDVAVTEDGGVTAPEDAVTDKLTADEAEQYDRQIRLWGLEAQKRLMLYNYTCVSTYYQLAIMCTGCVPVISL